MNIGMDVVDDNGEKQVLFSDDLSGCVGQMADSTMQLVGKHLRLVNIGFTTVEVYKNLAGLVDTKSRRPVLDKTGLVAALTG